MFAKRPAHLILLNTRINIVKNADACLLGHDAVSTTA